MISLTVLAEHPLWARPGTLHTESQICTGNNYLYFAARELRLTQVWQMPTGYMRGDGDPGLFDAEAPAIPPLLQSCS